MKLIHLSDLHIGKRLQNYSLIDDQCYILQRILEIVEAEKPDAVMISGDVYDKAVPPTEAITVFDDFLTELVAFSVPILITSGNHDSVERLSFGSRIMSSKQVYIAPTYTGDVMNVTLHDEYGDVTIHMLPYLTRAVVRAVFPDDNIESNTDAVRLALNKQHIDISQRNVLMAHQFVVGSRLDPDADALVGGLDNIDLNVFAAYDYVALGHIHSAQSLDNGRLRYCGSPLKYSIRHNEVKSKSVTVVLLGDKGDMKTYTVPLIPMRDVRSIRGTYEELSVRTTPNAPNTEDYVEITLTDEHEVPDAARKLTYAYPNILAVKYDNARTQAILNMNMGQLPEECAVTATELFAELFGNMLGHEMTESQKRIIEELVSELSEVLE